MMDISGAWYRRPANDPLLADPDGSLPSGPWFALPSGPMWAHTPVVDSKQNIWSSYIGANAIGEWDRKAGP